MDLHFSQILHVLGLEMTFWDDFPMILHGFAPRNPKNALNSLRKNMFAQNLERDIKCYHMQSSLVMVVEFHSEAGEIQYVFAPQ